MPKKPNTQKRERNVQAGRQAMPVDPHESDELKTALEKCESMFRKILDSVDPKKVQVTSTNDLYKISTGLAGIVKARIELERWSAEREGLLRTAYEGLCDEFHRLMAMQKPELVDVFYNIIEQAGENEKQRQQGGEPELDGPKLLE